MARYRMEDGTVVETDHSRSWAESFDCDGPKMISRATGSQWVHEKLRKSRKGRYYIEHTSEELRSEAWCEWVSPEHARKWLNLMGHELPEDLKVYEEDTE